MPDLLGAVMKGAEVGYTTKAVKTEQQKEDTARIVEAIKADIPVQIDAVRSRMLQEAIMELSIRLNTAEGLTALAQSVLLKKIEGAAETYRTEVLLGAANAEYSRAIAGNPAMKSMAVEGGLIQKYTPKAVWTYPDNIVALEARLKKEKAIAQETKTATRVEKALNLAEDTLFSIKI